MFHALDLTLADVPAAERVDMLGKFFVGDGHLLDVESRIVLGTPANFQPLVFAFQLQIGLHTRFVVEQDVASFAKAGEQTVFDVHSFAPWWWWNTALWYK